jgi:hypothetical protein
VSQASAHVGAFLLQDVYQGLTGIPRGEVKRLRIIGVPPKVQPQMNVPALGVSREETGKYVMGSVDVEADGSAYFQLPSGVPVFFQALDAEGRALQTMRSLAYVQPGELRSCVGCHEGRHTSPPPGTIPLAAKRAPSRVKADCEGTWPLRYDRLVQPALEQYCVSCHQKGQEAARFDLTEANSYDALLQYATADLHDLVFEKDASQPGHGPSLQSKLLDYLQKDDLHSRLGVPSTELQRLYTWMDTYGHSQGCFSHKQEKALLQLRRQYAFLFAD